MLNRFIRVAAVALLASLPFGLQGQETGTFDRSTEITPFFGLSTPVQDVDAYGIGPSYGLDIAHPVFGDLDLIAGVYQEVLYGAGDGPGLTRRNASAGLGWRGLDYVVQPAVDIRVSYNTGHSYKAGAQMDLEAFVGASGSVMLRVPMDRGRFFGGIRAQTLDIEFDENSLSRKASIAAIFGVSFGL